MSNELAEDVLIANSPGDQLRGLASEIENQNQFFLLGIDEYWIGALWGYRGCHCHSSAVLGFRPNFSDPEKERF